MSRGKFEKIGVPKEIYRQPANRFVADFIGNDNIFLRVAESVSNGVATFRTPVGVMSAFNIRPSLRTGEEADFFVNADQINVEAGAQGPNNVSGKLLSYKFFGNMVTLYLEMAAGLELKVSIPEPAYDRLNIRIGDMVAAGWKDDAAHVFAKNS
jgi:spermidine/putrescine transport system ATP-binding protein